MDIVVCGSRFLIPIQVRPIRITKIGDKNNAARKILKFMKMNKHNSVIAGAAICVAGLVLSNQSAHASITYDNTIAPIVGTGNTSGGWTSQTAGGVTLSLRAQSSVNGSTANTLGVYGFPAGAAASGPDTGKFNWDYWFDVKTDPDWTVKYGYTLTISSINDPSKTITIPIESYFPDDNGLNPNGSTWLTATEFQNAENLSFLGVDPNIIDGYSFTLDAYSNYLTSPQLVDSVSIIVNNGQNGGQTPPAAVPEPTTVAAGALMLLPFGMAVFKSVRSKRIA
jgi:hypothetical protein